MSKNNKNKTVFPHIGAGCDNFRSEVAKEFGLKGERENIKSPEGIDKNMRVSAESQMSGVPIYTKKENTKKE